MSGTFYSGVMAALGDKIAANILAQTAKVGCVDPSNPESQVAQINRLGILKAQATTPESSQSF